MQSKKTRGKTDISFEVFKFVDKAIDAYNNTDLSEEFIDYLMPNGPQSFEHWLNLAHEFHRRDITYIALDCWLECEKYIDDDNLCVVYTDMILSMIDADEHWEALSACNRLLKLAHADLIVKIKNDLENRFN